MKAAPGPAPVTGLYVPGDRPDRFEKAMSSGADLVVFDLEDSVASPDKERARRETARRLAGYDGEGTPIVQVRVNARSLEDLEMVSSLPPVVEVRLPKVADPAGLDVVTELVPGHAVTALIESAAGVLAAPRIARHPAVSRIALGEADLAAELAPGPQIIEHARLAVVFAAAAAGIEAPMLSVFPSIDDLEGLAEDTRRGAGIGFAGRMAVHPKQLAAISAAFRPSEAEVAWARSVVALLPAGGVARDGTGSMVDAAMRRRAERILERVSR